jgi:hypothetical protein
MSMYGVMQHIDHTAVVQTRVWWDRIVSARSVFSETAWTMMAILSHQLGGLGRSTDTRTVIHVRLSRRQTKANKSVRDWSNESAPRGTVGPTAASR